MTTKTTEVYHEVRPHDLFHDNEVKPCPICSSTERIVDDRKAEVTCARCGLVLDENIIDNGPEWRAFDHDQKLKRTRVGAPSTYAIADKGLPTDIDRRNKDSKGRNIPEANRQQLYRLRRWNKRLRISNASERNLAFALSELDRESSKLGIPRSIREDAAVIYRKAARNKLIRGRSIESMVAASIYTACRRNNIPRSLEEVSEVSNISKKQIGKNYRFLSRKLNIKLKPTSPIDYIPRFASLLDLSGEAESKAIEIINQSIKKGLNNGKGPVGMAAAALYISSILLNERRTQSDVAEVAGVTEVTIRNRYKELSEQVDSIII
ncbi:MAG: transcription initiation factor IIB [Methanobrevibacter sp.]|nr:transcription initiation factor IIB [Methanobrevibacter sp.]MBQ8016733.1 transcription initiation factor IIB [Methanobrevibacter sp.]